MYCTHYTGTGNHWGAYPFPRSLSLSGSRSRSGQCEQVISLSHCTRVAVVSAISSCIPNKLQTSGVNRSIFVGILNEIDRNYNLIRSWIQIWEKRMLFELRMITNARITYGINLHLTKVITSKSDMWHLGLICGNQPKVARSTSSVCVQHNLSKALQIQECTSSTTSRGYNIVSQWNVGH